MKVEKAVFKPIGVVHTPYKTKEGIPIQGGLFPGTKAQVEVYPEYSEGLSDLEGFSHILLVYLFNQSPGFDLKVKPFLDDKIRGVFATRAPRRPNPIGLTTVKLESVEGNILPVRGVDILDGTPLLDIKPYIPDIDSIPEAKTGWVKSKMTGERLSDGRFSRE